MGGARGLAEAMLPLVREQAMVSHGAVLAAVSSTLGPRMRELLGKANDWLDEGRNPFCESFLIEHQVTLDECMAMTAMYSLAMQEMLAFSKYHPASPPRPRCRPGRCASRRATRGARSERADA